MPLARDVLQKAGYFEEENGCELQAMVELASDAAGELAELQDAEVVTDFLPWKAVPLMLLWMENCLTLEHVRDFAVMEKALLRYRVPTGKQALQEEYSGVKVFLHPFTDFATLLSEMGRLRRLFQDLMKNPWLKKQAVPDEVKQMRDLCVALSGAWRRPPALFRQSRASA